LLPTNSETNIDKNLKNRKKKYLKKVVKSVKFELFGEELIEKSVKREGSSCRIYLPSRWDGCNIKIVRVD
jgi:hypothetical protein